MSFEWPLLLVALLLVPAMLALALSVDRRRLRYPLAYTNLDVLASVVEEQRSWRRWAPLALFLLALAFATGALARPHARLSMQDENATVVLVADVSGSMRANDVEPTRLDAAVAAMRTFLDRLPKQYQVGLVAFSSEAEVLAEPTTDRALLRQALTYLQPDAGTAIGDGLQAGVRLVSSSLLANGVRREPGKRVPGAIVLMSDGFQTRGRLQPQRAADNARAAGIRVHTVALGTENGVVQLGQGGALNSLRVPPDPAEMRDIARRTGGKTFTARSSARLSTIYRDLSSSIGHHREPREITSWFAAAAALLLVAAVAAGRIVAGRLP